MQEEKDIWKEKQHVQERHVKRACMEYLMMLGLGFL
jgi:hypothetical protein